MAVLTMGTTAQTTLKAMKFAFASSSATFMADLATLEALIQDDLTPGSGFTSPAWGSRVGALQPGSTQLFIPNRGVLTILPGDFIAVDTQTGFPILVSAAAAAAAGWVHT